MRKIPFYGNLPDDNHCATAVQKSIIEYFTGRKLNWEEAEKLSGFQKNKAAWTVDIWTRLTKQGFDIKMIEPFDYLAFAKEGEAYLHRLYRPEAVAWQLANTNVMELKHLDEFLRIVKPEKRRASLSDIDRMLEEGRLVFVVLNSKALNNQQGYVDHAVLVFDKNGDQYTIHDPGLPPQPNRQVAKAKLWEAMGGDEHTTEVTGIKLQAKSIRADLLLAGNYPQYSRAVLAKLFEKDAVRLDDKILKAGDKIKPGRVLDADLSSLESDIPTIDLPILYEDDDCIVINKPAGVLTHALGKHGNEASVASFIRSKVQGIEGERAGIVHRLDRATSGVIIGAKNQAALSWLQKQFAQRKTKKTYVAIVEGTPKQQEAIIDMPIGRNPKAPSTFRVDSIGKPAKTHYKVLKESKNRSLLELSPETGRTHQLRVHLQKIGHSIVGDPLYGGGSYGDRLLLHAKSLEITLPNHQRVTFEAPIPADFEKELG